MLITSLLKRKRIWRIPMSRATYTTVHYECQFSKQIWFLVINFLLSKQRIWVSVSKFASCKQIIKAIPFCQQICLAVSNCFCRRQLHNNHAGRSRFTPASRLRTEMISSPAQPARFHLHLRFDSPFCRSFQSTCSLVIAAYCTTPMVLVLGDFPWG